MIQSQQSYNIIMFSHSYISGTKEVKASAQTVWSQSLNCDSNFLDSKVQKPFSNSSKRSYWKTGPKDCICPFFCSYWVEIVRWKLKKLRERVKILRFKVKILDRKLKLLHKKHKFGAESHNFEREGRNYEPKCQNFDRSRWYFDIKKYEVWEKSTKLEIKSQKYEINFEVKVGILS